MTKPTSSELEQTLLREALPPKGTHPSVNQGYITEAALFAQNTMRKAPLKSQVLVALDYLARYGYASRYTPTRMNGK